MFISYCTTCRNRLDDLKKTLPVNLALLRPNDEIVLLDYNSPDCLRQWVLNNFMPELSCGKLRLYSESLAARFFTAHAKNVCHLLGKGLALVNLDADNYLTQDYVTKVATTDWLRTSILFPVTGSGGFKGRVAVNRDVFKFIGGYDEAMCYGYGEEEIDLYKRIKVKVGRVTHIKLDASVCIATSAENKAAGQIDGCSVEASTRRHKQISADNLRERRLIANQSICWGEATLLNYESYVVRTGREPAALTSPPIVG